MKEDNSNRGNVSPDELQNQIEAILFASGKRLNVNFIKEITGVDNVRKVKNALQKIKVWYDENNKVLMITQEGDEWKINVRESYVDVVRKIVSETDLSRAILETLSVIAWKSPVFQSEIINIRGAGAYDHISSLQESGFITKEKEGRSYIVKVTNKFFEYFDIEGSEGIRDVFKKIKESPGQKKVDEFQGKIGDLDVVKVEGEENEIKELIDLEKEELGKLEVYKDKNEYEESAKEIFDENDLGKDSVELEKEKSENDKESEEKEVMDPLKTRTQEIVEELLSEPEEERSAGEKLYDDAEKDIEETEGESEGELELNHESKEIIEEKISSRIGDVIENPIQEELSKDKKIEEESEEKKSVEDLI